jgi:short subunit dehydrogenase-like uncharacterized protein
VTSSFLIYGANGYTGELTARFAVERGLHPVLAGRNAVELEALANRLDLEHRIFGLDETELMDHALSTVDAVLHCAGPFLHTHKQMAAACLRTATHYLDITGEIAVYSALSDMDVEAKNRGVMLLPGIGFDVVPTDCLAAHLKRRLPRANQLALAFRSFGPAPITRGTGKTFVEGLGHPGYVRKDGVMTPVPHLSKSRVIDFGDGRIKVPRMTWGDVFAAYHSTGIPNIEGYFEAPSMVRLLLKMSRHLRPLISWDPVQRVLMRNIAAWPPGPTDKEREKTHTVVWGEVEDDQGNTATSRLRGPEGYTFTVLASLAAIQRVILGDAPAGYQTPSSAYGADFVLEIEGVVREDVN